MYQYVGCSGWSYDSWLSHFYPAGLKSKQWLEYYSKVFDYVEIDSSFYRVPNQFMVKRWAKVTPENFRFTAKFPQEITHKKRLYDIEGDLDYFYEAMAPLASKLVCLLLQLPPSMTMKEGLKKLQKLPLDKRFRYAVEARHKSWFDDEVYSSFKENDICLAWSQLVELQTPPVDTTDFIYLRFIGDRSIDENDFGKIQIDRTREMEYWASVVKKLSNNKKLKIGVVAANNHYAGFGPGTANTFRKMVGLPAVQYEERNQTTLSDF
jgi:uncharacterized protein YecE (DUF72 family)